MNHSEDHFTNVMFRRMLFPSLFSSMGLAFSDMMDAIVVGRSMGDVGLAAIGMILPYYMIINVCMHGLGIGGSVHYARLLSEGREEEAVFSFQGVIQTAVILSVFIGGTVFLFPSCFLRLLGISAGNGGVYGAALDYIRVIALGTPLFFLSYILNDYLLNDDNAKIAGIGFLVGNVVDIVLNVVFVTILQQGTKGAAMATVIGLVVSLLCYLPGLRSRSHSLKLNGKWEKICFHGIIHIFRIGFSTFVQYLYQMIFLLTANRLLMLRMGKEGVAVFDMLQNASYLILYLYTGAAKAMQPLSSTFYGERNDRAAKEVRKLAMIAGSAAGLTAIALLVSFPEKFCLIFGLEETNVRQIGAYALRIYCMGAGFAGISTILESYYQSVSEEICAFVIAILRGAIILLPLSLFLGMYAPGRFWYLFPAAEALSLAVFFIWRHFFYRAGQTTAPEKICSLTIRGCTDDIGKLIEKMEAFCELQSADRRQKYFIIMSVEEISNAIIQGGFAKIKDGLIQITLIALENGKFELHIRDNASSFNPFSLEMRKATQPDDVDLDAVGMYVIKQQADYYFYREYQGFNSLIVRI